MPKQPAFQLTDSPIKVHTSATSVQHMFLTNSGSKDIPIKMSATECGKTVHTAHFLPSTFVLKSGTKVDVTVTLHNAHAGELQANANVVTGHAANGASVGLSLDTLYVVPGSQACPVSLPAPSGGTGQGFPTLMLGALLALSFVLFAIGLTARNTYRKAS